jgi:hypothetical protein
MSLSGKCPICGSKASVEEFTERTRVVCIRCGKFALTDIARKLVPGLEQDEAIKISGWIREHESITISSDDLPLLRKLPNLTVGEKAEKILIRLAKRFPKPGEIQDLSEGAHLEFMAVGRLTEDRELQFFIRDYLYAEMDFLIRHELVTDLGDDSRYSISPKGWAHLESLRHGNPESQIGFIAMWFDDSMNTAQIAIESGIREAGYKPFRVDQKEHNNDITDEIIAGIRGCRFLVADLTGHRNGVYYEAGFAKGLGLEVVWLCRKSDEKDRHFDIRQLSTIFWEEDKLPELSKALQKRIEASIGRGPLQHVA